MAKSGIENNRAEILGQVRNPLIFFALALLVIEGSITTLVATSSKLSSQDEFRAVEIMAGLFVMVVGIVAWITYRVPSHLYEVTRRLEEVERKFETVRNEFAAAKTELRGSG